MWVDKEVLDQRFGLSLTLLQDFHPLFSFLLHKFVFEILNSGNILVIRAHELIKLVFKVKYFCLLLLHRNCIGKFDVIELLIELTEIVDFEVLLVKVGL